MAERLGLDLSCQRSRQSIRFVPTFVDVALDLDAALRDVRDPRGDLFGFPRRERVDGPDRGAGGDGVRAAQREPACGVCGRDPFVRRQAHRHQRVEAGQIQLPDPVEDVPQDGGDRE
ncbi:hypothetical protein [Actinomadura oligospora]|uniref:hypothetical protein n=1 Tax=Actinomadura oligospora TaxID=111804 RepID=UPI0012FBF403|nr:hypothetical protein [Actinomadura oligospora]